MEGILRYTRDMKKVAATEYAGPCPFCGDGGAGSDRFHVWTDSQRGGGRYWCRQCGAKGDGIDLLRKAHGMTFQQACGALGIQPKASNRPGWNGSTPRPAASGADPSPAKAKNPDNPDNPERMPSAQWQQRAGELLRECQRGFNEDDFTELPAAAVRIFADKGISPLCASAFDVGYNPADKFIQAAEFGLEGNGVKIPAGVVIGIRRPSGIMALTVRLENPIQRGDTLQRYWDIRGSGQGLGFVAGRKRGKPVVLVESALDAVVIGQFAGDIAVAIAANGNSKKIDHYAAEFVRQAQCVVVMGDNDEGGKTADKNLKDIAKFCGRNGYLIGSIYGKDIGEQHAATLSKPELPATRDFVAFIISEAMKHQQAGRRA